jgi:ABC-type glycerol-3-phosphate transport system substrate-binding protein
MVSYGAIIAVSHGVYYNVDLFNELGIAIPETWEELLAAAQTLKDNGYDAFANASGDPWTIAEIVFMNSPQPLSAAMKATWLSARRTLLQ